jgi:hypothetical protein
MSMKISYKDKITLEAITEPVLSHTAIEEVDSINLTQAQTNTKSDKSLTGLKISAAKSAKIITWITEKGRYIKLDVTGALHISPKVKIPVPAGTFKVVLGK